MSHRCVNQTTPSVNGNGPCTCPDPGPRQVTVQVLVDHVPYEGETVMGVFGTVKEAWVWGGEHIDDFAGTPKVLQFTYVEPLDDL